MDPTDLGDIPSDMSGINWRFYFRILHINWYTYKVCSHLSPEAEISTVTSPVRADTLFLSPPPLGITVRRYRVPGCRCLRWQTKSEVDSPSRWQRADRTSEPSTTSRLKLQGWTPLLENRTRRESEVEVISVQLAEQWGGVVGGAWGNTMTQGWTNVVKK